MTTQAVSSRLVSFGGSYQRQRIILSSTSSAAVSAIIRPRQLVVGVVNSAAYDSTKASRRFISFQNQQQPQQQQQLFDCVKQKQHHYQQRCLYSSQIRYFTTYPSHQVVGLPSLSPTMDSGSIASWNKQEGDTFGPGDSLCSVETDKATVDFEAQDEGVIAKILVPAGSGAELKVGDPIVITVEDVADVAAFAQYTLADATAAAGGGGSSSSSPAAATSTVTATPPVATPVATPTPSAVVPTSSQSSDGKRVVASPLAHLLAKEMGYVISNIPGTGPDGRIIAADVREYVPSTAAAAATIATPTSAPMPAAAAATPVEAPARAVLASAHPIAGAGYTDYPISESARLTAARLMQSKRNVPHYYLTVDICVDELLKLRSTINSTDKNRIGLYELLIKAAAMSMKTVPSVNASWMDSVVRVYDSVDMNIVVGSGDWLYTPVIRDCARKGLSAISNELNVAVEAATASSSESAKPNDDIGTFTILNLGMYGIKSCAPIIREPQSCALAIGTIENRIVPGDGDDELYKQSVMFTATVACDHRVVDGAVGAQWLASFKSHIENPFTLLL